MLVGSRVRATNLVRWRDSLLVLVVAGLLYGSGLSLHWTIAMIVLLVVVALLIHVRPQRSLIQIDQLDHQQWRWQWSDQADVCRGQLIRVEHWPYVVVLHLQTIIPKARKQRLLLWRDQVDVTAWRRLQVLARFYGQGEH